ncbi:lysozyme [Tieghemostelium lacteum]|uniref:Lysozyme n=1 Tax=Tieghemostelium lacteum TaxID=361077 RepID=A0A152A573_TIELA|nr:lysozyme [Tieghemostelium lacteum]|eukprot:KYR01392.1 lysozyme [Tieghemostelium lacteum]
MKLLVALVLLCTVSAVYSYNCQCHYSNGDVKVYQSLNEKQCLSKCETEIKKVHIENCQMENNKCTCQDDCTAVVIAKATDDLVGMGHWSGGCNSGDSSSSGGSGTSGSSGGSGTASSTSYNGPHWVGGDAEYEDENQIPSGGNQASPSQQFCRCPLSLLSHRFK